MASSAGHSEKMNVRLVQQSAGRPGKLLLPRILSPNLSLIGDRKQEEHGNDLLRAKRKRGA